MNTPPCPRTKSIHVQHHIASSKDKLQKNDNDSVTELHTMANTPSLDQSSSSSPSQDSSTNVYNDDAHHETYVVDEYVKGSDDEKNPITRTYQLGKLLGKGSFAKVYLCTVAENEKHRFAMKIIPKAPLVHRPAMNEVRCIFKEDPLQHSFIHSFIRIVVFIKIYTFLPSFFSNAHTCSFKERSIFIKL
jgi:hypothetical protein